MLLEAKLKQTGDLFFRYRSHIPFFLVIFLLFGYQNLSYLERYPLLDGLFTLLCFLISLSGLFMRIVAVGYSKSGTSGRNTRSQQAAGLNQDGIYSIMRNPLYLGNFIMIFGVSLLSQSYQVVLFNIAASLCFYVPIILKEEEFLLQSFGEEYRRYAEFTPAIIPNLKLWRSSGTKFNWIRIIYREKDTFIGVVCGFYALELLRDFAINKKFIFTGVWTWFFAGTVIFWIVANSLKPKLKRLDLNG